MIDLPEMPPVYEYMYSYDGSLTTIDPFILTPTKLKLKLLTKYFLDYDIFDQDFGVSHADELFLMFRPHLLPVPTLFTEKDNLVSNRTIKVLTDFVK